MEELLKAPRPHADEGREVLEGIYVVPRREDFRNVRRPSFSSGGTIRSCRIVPT
jgi:hypothetical protein